MRLATAPTEVAFLQLGTPDHQAYRREPLLSLRSELTGRDRHPAGRLRE
jgi:hypothetical protein